MTDGFFFKIMISILSTSQKYLINQDEVDDEEGSKEGKVATSRE